jgi:histidinol-phosphate phosphatase family protein
MTGDGADARPAVFLDRDGTIIDDTGYVSRPEDVSLLPGAASAISRLNQAGVPVVVVSNQSGIGRGYFDTDAYERVRVTIEELLRTHGARLTATYICPHAPGVGDPCECRKPGTLLYRRASTELGLDAARSWYIGDRWRDIAPAITLGGHGILVPGPHTPAEDLAQARERFEIASTLEDAVERALKGVSQWVSESVSQDQP